MNGVSEEEIMKEFSIILVFIVSFTGKASAYGDHSYCYKSPNGIPKLNKFIEFKGDRWESFGDGSVYIYKVRITQGTGHMENTEAKEIPLINGYEFKLDNSPTGEVYFDEMVNGQLRLTNNAGEYGMAIEMSKAECFK